MDIEGAEILELIGKAIDIMVLRNEDFYVDDDTPDLVDNQDLRQVAWEDIVKLVAEEIGFSVL